jgi:O-antigen/teichoic acid export membrane protein
MPRGSMTETAPRHASSQLVKGIGTTMLARLGAVIELVAQPLYVLMFGLAGYGLYAVLWAAINLLANIFDLGMTTGLQRTIPQAPDRSAEAKALRAALILGIGPCIVVAAAISLAANSLAPLINVAQRDAAAVAPAIMLFVWALPLWAFVEVSTAALRAKQLFGPEIRLRIFWEQLIRLVLAALFFAGGIDLFGLFIAHLLSLAITAVLCWRLLARHYPMTDLLARGSSGGFMAGALRAGLATLPHSVAARLFTDAPPLVLNALLPGSAGAAYAGLFVIIRKIASLVHLVRIAFAYVLAPVASLAQREDRSAVAEVYGFAVRLACVVALPLAMAMSGAAPALLALFGPEAAVAALPLILLLLARAVEAVLGPAQPVLQVTGRYRSQFVGSLGGLLVAVGAGYYWVAASPLTGMAGAVAAGFLAAALIPVMQLVRDQALFPALHGGGRMLAAALGGGGIAWLLLLLSSQFLPWQAVLVALIPIGLGGIWTSARLGLTQADRLALGKTARRLKLA